MKKQIDLRCATKDKFEAIVVNKYTFTTLHFLFCKVFFHLLINVEGQQGKEKIAMSLFYFATDEQIFIV